MRFGGIPFAVALGVLASSGVASAQADFAVLHTFAGPPDDGASPRAPLIQATDGNLYGTTVSGGAFGLGTVFSMTPDGAVTVLHAFTGTDGAAPGAALIQAADGNLYGTTVSGGPSGLGTIFTIAGDGTFATLHAFSGADGAGPAGALIQAREGTFYGTTVSGSASDRGTVFTMALDGSVTVLHSFAGGADGATPRAGLIQATDGNLYGTTEAGGDSNHGTVFMMTPAGSLIILHAFAGGSDGAAPRAGTIQATDLNFYGTTYNGGSGDRGSIYQMTPDGTVTVLHMFAGGRRDQGYRRSVSRRHPHSGFRRELLRHNRTRRCLRPRHSLQNVL